MRTLFAAFYLLLFAVMACPDFLLAADAPDSAAPEDKNTLTTAEPNQNIDDIAVMPLQKDLSPEGRETYAYLLFIQALIDEDEAALLDVVPLLRDGDAPLNVWLDGGVWLMSRKSTNAVTYLEQAVKTWPNDLSLNLLLAEAYGDHGMPDKGVDLMRAYLKNNPDALDAKLELALLLVKNKEFTEAQKILEQITQKQRTPLVDYYQARALLGMNRRSEAINYLRKAIKGMPDFLEALAELAFAYEQEGNLKEARNTYEKLQKLNFSPQDVGLRLINLSMKLKQPEKALQYIKQGPDSIPFKLTAANMLMQSRHYLQAESILKQIAAKPDAPVEVYLLLADITYEQRRNLNLALAWLDKIPENSRGYDKACFLRVQLMAEAGKTAQALTEADKFVKQFPEMAEFADFRIRLLAKEHKTEDALAAAREAVKKWPDNTGFSFLLGSLLDESGKKSEAMAVMEDIIKKQPENFQALNYVGFTLAEENRDLQRALELLTKADQLSPDQAYIVDSLAWALFRAGKGKEALQQIRRAINLGDTQDAAIWEHYGDIAKAEGKKDEARKAYRKAIELKPANIDKIRSKLSKI